MPKNTSGDLLDTLVEQLNLDMSYDAHDAEKLASTKEASEEKSAPAETDKVASFLAEVDEALAEKTAAGLGGPHGDERGADTSMQGTTEEQSQEVIDTGRNTETPGQGTEAAKQTDSSGLASPPGQPENSANDSSEKDGAPAPGEEHAAAEQTGGTSKEASLSPFAQGLLTDLMEAHLDTYGAEHMSKHASNLASARARLLKMAEEEDKAKKEGMPDFIAKKIEEKEDKGSDDDKKKGMPDFIAKKIEDAREGEGGESDDEEKEASARRNRFID
jgi:hypothetical protein